MIAKHFITTNIEPVKLTESGADILYHLDEHRLHDIPVVDGRNLMGSVTESDVYTLEDPDKPLKQLKFTFKRDFVYEGQHIFDIMKMMSLTGLTMLPVLDENEKYLGCIQQGDMMKRISEILAVNNLGAIIVLEINQNDFVLSEIARLVESQDSKIMNLFVTTNSDSTKMDVTIKLNTMEIQALMQSFNRYNYIVKATYTEDEKMYDDLRDRYDSLMRYLNV
ncbi:MAG: CBS domain-containing protein [Bacteroidales bacterium]|nr:CBS domain-containing protein [Bacteroidales bacterium]